jgi:predicted phosphodiesterase
MYVMDMAFDLLSDLHLDTWPHVFDWTHRATSPYCILAGDVAADRRTVLRTLKHLGECYQAVFYIDGNEEHSHYWGRLDQSYQLLEQRVKGIRDVVYLQDNVVMINGVAILATNGWWGFDFDEHQDVDSTINWYQGKWQHMVDRNPSYPASVSDQDVIWMIRRAINDAAYLVKSVTRLQTHGEVKKIIIVTHSVPFAHLISHDPDLVGDPRFSTMGNAYMSDVLAADVAKKIHTWCFGHYHLGVDRVINGIRYVNNCQGRAGTRWSNLVYNPLRICLDQ